MDPNKDNINIKFDEEGLGLLELQTEAFFDNQVDPKYYPEIQIHILQGLFASFKEPLLRSSTPCKIVDFDTDWMLGQFCAIVNVVLMVQTIGEE